MILRLFRRWYRSNTWYCALGVLPHMILRFCGFSYYCHAMEGIRAHLGTTPSLHLAFFASLSIMLEKVSLVSNKKPTSLTSSTELAPLMTWGHHNSGWFLKVKGSRSVIARAVASTDGRLVILTTRLGFDAQVYVWFLPVIGSVGFALDWADMPVMGWQHVLNPC